MTASARTACWATCGSPLAGGPRRRLLLRLGDVAAEGFRGHGLWFRAAAYSRVQSVERFQLVLGELEVEDVEVGGDSFGIHRLRDRRSSLLEVPAQHDLGRRLAVLGG